jgi:hypothetical protein
MADLLGRVLLALALLVPAAPSAMAQEEPTPLARAHAHNDYEHERPLFDALDRGFTSVEADVWLVGDQLLVAHDLVDVQPDRTLESLYLDPLRGIVKRNKGSVYRGWGYEFQLLIDIKSDGLTTYRRLHEVLAKYGSMLTRFTPGGVKAGAVIAVVSGNRPREYMQDQEVRFAAYDGRLSDLGSGDPASFIPLISDNWTNHFTWRGSGEMPETERQKLRGIVETAHANGQRVRFWETPDQPGTERDAVWSELLDAGVDHINTDDLTGLQEFLLENDPAPSRPHVTWEVKRIAA